MTKHTQAVPIDLEDEGAPAVAAVTGERLPPYSPEGAASSTTASGADRTQQQQDAEEEEAEKERIAYRCVHARSMFPCDPADVCANVVCSAMDVLTSWMLEHFSEFAGNEGKLLRVRMCACVSTRRDVTHCARWRCTENAALCYSGPALAARCVEWCRGAHVLCA